MKPNSIWQRSVALMMCAVILASCGGVPKRAMDADSRRSLSSVAIILPENPKEYVVLGAADIPGGFLLYAFGMLGGAALGGMMASKMEHQARALTASFAPHQVALGADLGAALKAEFEARGVTVKMIPPPARDKENKYDYTTVSVAEQAIVEPIVTLAGYRLTSGSLKPMLGTRVRVLDAQSKQEKYFDIFLYGDKMGDNFVRVEPQEQTSYGELEQLYADGAQASKALRKGAAEISKTVVAAIKG